MASKPESRQQYFSPCTCWPSRSKLLDGKCNPGWKTTHADRLTRHIRRVRSGQWRTTTPRGSLSLLTESKRHAGTRVHANSRSRDAVMSKNRRHVRICHLVVPTKFSYESLVR